ncbi:glycerophosphocholine phosphodiesterase GPCPD1-like isoform X2 [Asterias amurensis]|uniref:glycerophosphocholine phosphodiesterase GPCPD1-like isoform X2 n=1 Tax=Asterias amurensis TaxID=7602 RepID=UPI003AB85FD4
MWMTCTVHFHVETTALTEDKIVCLTGDASELGQWSVSQVIRMSSHDGAVKQGRWSIVVTLPRDREVKYRYAICSFHGNSDAVRVLQWESARIPRTLLTQGDKMTVDDGKFGTIDGVSKIERGWLTTHSEYRLMVDSDPFTPAAGCGVSAYSIHISASSQDDIGSGQQTGAGKTSPSKRMKTCCKTEPVLIRVLNSEEHQPHEQQPGGRLINSDDYSIYSVQSMKPGSVVFTIDLYSCDNESNGPTLLGKSWLLGSNVKSDATEDQVLPVLLGTQIVGVLSVRSIVIHPLSPSSLCNMEVSYSTHWKWNRATLDGSHRGFGRSHRDSSLLQDIPVYSHVPENTIRAFQKGALHGADFVEFDVNVTKDHVPIVYHDCEAKLTTKDTSKDSSAPLKLPFWAMTLDQLRSLRKGYPFVVDEVSPYHSKQGESPSLSEADWPEEIRPFPELQQVLHALPIHCGANIEVKFPMTMEDEAKESDFPPPDRNTIVDTILNIVLRHGGARRIVFSAFDPEICTMLRLKQNKYPVHYLNYGRTDKYLCYKDPRSNTVTNAMWFALSEEMAGLVCHNDDVIREPSILKAANDKGLVVFVWGEDNNRPDLVKSLKDMGVQGIIHDRVSLNPENSPNIYLQEKGAPRN